MIIATNKASTIDDSLYNMIFINKLYRAYSFSLKEQTIEYLVHTKLVPPLNEVSSYTIQQYKSECYNLSNDFSKGFSSINDF